jgi:ftsK/spoIIIE family cell division protein
MASQGTKKVKKHKSKKDAGRTKKQKSKTPSYPSRFITFIRSLGSNDAENNGRLDTYRAIGGIILLGLSCFIFISLLFYVLDAKAVYSQLHSEDIIEAELSNQSIGKDGISIGYSLFNGFLGWGGFVSSIIFPYIAIALLWMNRKETWHVLGKCILIILSSLWLGMVLAFLQTFFGGEDSVLKWGGDLGYYYTTFLSGRIGQLGVVLFFIISLLVLAMLFNNKLVDKITNISFSLSSKSKSVEHEDDDEEDEEDDDTEDEDEPSHIPSQDKDAEEDEEEPTIEEPISIITGAPKSEEPTMHVSTPTAVPQTTTEPKEGEDTELTVTVPQSELADEDDFSDEYVPGMYLKHYRKPSLDLLEDYGLGTGETDRDEIEETKRLILDTLRNFRISVTPISATVGPTVTLYEVIPEQGVKVSSILRLNDDLMIALKSQGIRITPIPHKGTVGIEVPNRKPQTVSMRSIMGSKKFREAQEKMELPIGMGKTISNEPFVFDLAKMPHILMAGATGQGKSVGLNALITSLLYSKRPEELKLIMVDPKMLEFSIYEDLEKHFMAMPNDADKAIITDLSKVVPTLNSLCVEMDQRYEQLARARVRNIKDYNEQVREGKLSRRDGFDFLPYIVLIVDEWSDLIMTAGREAEQPIARLAQKARAAGIHIVLATQRPSTDVVTGLIKANFPARIAFRVASGIDSSTILNNPSAHNLIGRGDMLFFQGNELVRIQCAFMDTPETEKIVQHIARQESEGHAYELPEYVAEGDSKLGQDLSTMKKDALFEEAARLIVSSQMGSASFIQRKMEIGFARAGRIVDQLEAAGILGPNRGSKPRDVLIQDLMSLEELLGQLK